MPHINTNTTLVRTPVDVFIDFFYRLESYATPSSPLLFPSAEKWLPKPENSWKSSILSPLLEYFNDQKSPFSSRLPLMSPFQVAGIVATYLVLVVLGKWAMKRFPCCFELKKLSGAYQVFMMVLSGYVAYETAFAAWGQGKVFAGNQVDDSVGGLLLVKMIWLQYISKIFQLADTLFLLLRKSSNPRQLTSAHIFHHTTSVFIWWFITLLTPTGDAYLPSTLFSTTSFLVAASHQLLSFKHLSALQKCFTHLHLLQYFLVSLQCVLAMWKSCTSLVDDPSFQIKFGAQVPFWYSWGMFIWFGHLMLHEWQREADLKAKQERRVQFMEE
ncbi:Elongation of very long chain fatty acids protein 1 [Chytridiales sp. JEL 0842]|nr:Elongation of very long chain fatty acids protein 1 [Chytridiales sp. JEL 0842]